MEEEVIQKIFRNQDDLLFRLKNIETLVCNKLGVTEKELGTGFNKVRKEIIMSTYEHEPKPFSITLNPIVVTNE